MLNSLKKLIPRRFVTLYHWGFTYLAAVFYRFPSRQMTVIGVTGTNGKSSTVQFIGQLLRVLGENVGWTTTESFRIGDELIANKTRMTMLGRFLLHRMMRRMVKNGCSYAVVEVSSEGVAQHRVAGIGFDVGVFTNLTPEHIEAHGGFDNYKAAKLGLFEMVGRRGGFSVVNLNDKYAGDFAGVDVSKVVGYFRDDMEVSDVVTDEVLAASDVRVGAEGSRVVIDGGEVAISVPGGFNVSNVLAAIAVVREFGFEWDDIVDGVSKLVAVPGRLEVFECGSVTVVVDYAHEPAGLEALFEVVEGFGCNRVVHVFGSAGGDRDKARRPVMGRLTARFADVAVICDEDPRDEDPLVIIDSIAEGALEGGMVLGENLFKVQDREAAIRLGFEMAGDGDCVLVTGKGSESVIIMENGRTVDSDDREIVNRIIDEHEYC